MASFTAALSGVTLYQASDLHQCINAPGEYTHFSACYLNWCNLNTSSVINPESRVFQVWSHQTYSPERPSYRWSFPPCDQVVCCTSGHSSWSTTTTMLFSRHFSYILGGFCYLMPSRMQPTKWGSQWGFHPYLQLSSTNSRQLLCRRFSCIFGADFGAACLNFTTSLASNEH